MILGLPVGELIGLAIAILVAGAVAGMLAGLLGIGGAAIIVPLLYELFRLLGVPDEVRMQLCVGTSLAFIVPTSIRSYLAHRAKGSVRDDILRLWAAPIVLGVLIGAGLAYFAPGAVFKIVFVIGGGFISAKLLLGREHWKLDDKLPGSTAMRIAGFAIGLFSSLMGVGGGAFATIFLTLHGLTIHVAIATSSGVGVLISIPGAIGYMIAGWPYQAQLPPFSVGYVSFLALALFAPASVLAAPYGARLTHRLSRRTLEVAFGVFLLLVSIRFLISLIV
jgi:uncharacterized membrane protein YfcA